MSDEKIEQIRAKVTRLREELKAAEQELHAAQIEGCPVKVGDRVKGRDGKLYEVAYIRRSIREFWIAGHPILKNGLVGKLTKQLYEEWEPA